MFDKKMLESAELYDKRYKNFATLVVVPVFILCVALVVFLLFARKELTIDVVGEIEPVKIISQVQSTSPNTLVENNLAEGSVVEANELLVKYDDSSDLTELNSLIAQLNQLEDQKNSLAVLQESVDTGKSDFTQSDAYGYYQEFESYLAQREVTKNDVAQENQNIAAGNDSIEKQQGVINGQLDEIQQQIDDYEEIRDAVENSDPSSGSDSASGNVRSGNPYIDLYQNYQQQTAADPAQKPAIQSQALAAIESDIDSLQNSKQSLQIQAAGLSGGNASDSSLASQLLLLQMQESQKASQDLTDLDSSMADLNTKIAVQKQANKNDAVYSSASGVLHVLPNVLGVKSIVVGTPIAQIYPALSTQTKVYITVYISSRDIVSIKPGQTMRLTVAQNLPHPLILTGKVAQIDSLPDNASSAASGGESQSSNYFRVRAMVTLSKKAVSMVRYGLQGNASIVTGEKTYFDYYKDRLFSEK